MFSFVSLAPSPGGSKSIEFDRDVLRGVVVKSGILREESRYGKLPIAFGKGYKGERVFVTFKVGTYGNNSGSTFASHVEVYWGR